MSSPPYTAISSRRESSIVTENHGRVQKPAGFRGFGQPHHPPVRADHPHQGRHRGQRGDEVARAEVAAVPRPAGPPPRSASPAGRSTQERFHRPDVRAQGVPAAVTRVSNGTASSSRKPAASVRTSAVEDGAAAERLAEVVRERTDVEPGGAADAQLRARARRTPSSSSACAVTSTGRRLHRLAGPRPHVGALAADHLRGVERRRLLERAAEPLERRGRVARPRWRVRLVHDEPRRPRRRYRS